MIFNPAISNPAIAAFMASPWTAAALAAGGLWIAGRGAMLCTRLGWMMAKRDVTAGRFRHILTRHCMGLLASSHGLIALGWAIALAAGFCLGAGLQG